MSAPTLQTRLEVALTIKRAIDDGVRSKSSDRHSAAQVFFMGDVAVATMVAPLVKAGSHNEMLLLDQDGEAVEIFASGKTMGEALSAGIEAKYFAQVSLSGRQSSITGRFGEIEKLRKWVWQPYGRDEVELVDITTTSPFSLLFRRPPTSRGRLPLPLSNLRDQQFSALFNKIPLFTYDHGIADSAFPIASGPLTLLLLLMEVFHPDRKSPAHEREASDRHMFAIKLLLETRHDTKDRHRFVPVAQQNVFNLADPTEFTRLSRLVDNTSSAGLRITQLIDLEVEKQIISLGRVSAEEIGRMRQELQHRWTALLTDLDDILQHGQSHHTTHDLSYHPSSPLSDVAFPSPRPAFHPGAHQSGARQVVNVGGGRSRLWNRLPASPSGFTADVAPHGTHVLVPPSSVPLTTAPHSTYYTPSAPSLGYIISSATRPAPTAPLFSPPSLRASSFYPLPASSVAYNSDPPNQLVSPQPPAVLPSIPYTPPARRASLYYASPTTCCLVGSPGSPSSPPPAPRTSSPWVPTMRDASTSAPPPTPSQWASRSMPRSYSPPPAPSTALPLAPTSRLPPTSPPPLGRLQSGNTAAYSPYLSPVPVMPRRRSFRTSVPPPPPPPLPLHPQSSFHPNPPADPRPSLPRPTLSTGPKTFDEILQHKADDDAKSRRGSFASSISGSESAPNGAAQQRSGWFSWRRS